MLFSKRKWNLNGTSDLMVGCDPVMPPWTACYRPVLWYADGLFVNQGRLLCKGLEPNVWKNPVYSTFNILIFNRPGHHMPCSLAERAPDRIELPYPGHQSTGFFSRKSWGRAGPARLSVGLKGKIVKTQPPPHVGTKDKHTHWVGSVSKQKLLYLYQAGTYMGCDGGGKAWDGPKRNKKRGPIVVCHVNGSWAETGLHTLARLRKLH